MTTMTSVGPTQLLIDGQWVDSLDDGKTFATFNPATEEKIADVAQGGQADIDRAVQAARKAFETGAWPDMDARDRGHLLYKLADLIEQNAEELAALETLDNGKPLSVAKAADLPLVIDCFRYYAGWADKIQGKTIPVRGNYHTYTRHEPVGVCGQIIPWNFPLLMAAWKLGPALATGCTVILKPAEQTPLTALRLGELIIEAGFPAGVVNIVNGLGETAGAALVAHPQVDKIAFTGEYKTAQIIMRNAADTLKRLTFELGGKSPNIIFADADIDAAIEGAHLGLFFNQGQCCCAGSRLFVEQSIYDQVVAKLVEKTNAQILGDPFDQATEQGPQIDQAQYDKILSYIEQGKAQGAQCVAGGQAVEGKGFYIQPTIFAGVRDDMTIAREEIFGPVLCVLPFEDMEEVIRRGNDSFFGLAAAVWTKDVSKAHTMAKRLRAGTVWVNCYDVFDIGAPFGGFKMSGMGREMGEYALRNYTEVKTVTVAL